MLRNRLYYRFKPFLPAPLRVAVRRWFAQRKRARVTNTWPILPGSEKPPPGWPGWPEGKQFALVLTHDVEGRTGLDRVRPLAELEKKLGFRSSFNFVPDGDYQIPSELIRELQEDGFEVGVHDLHHDGKLFSSRAHFRECAGHINRYLKDWRASGFRAGFMHHKLDWMHDLNVEYDSSTFDTDPFEPQPDGVGTIFPFWVEKGEQKAESRKQNRDPAPRFNDSTIQRFNDESLGSGYVELPYTLPQDSTLFLLFREKTIDIWRRKLDWIAEHGGMAMLIVHPDYAVFDGEKPGGVSYAAESYGDFLDYVRSHYRGKYWAALPKEVALFAKASLATKTSKESSLAIDTRPKRKKIWIDLDNTPHVPFFEPIAEELSRRGFEVVFTARDAFQVCELAAQKGLHYKKIGRHYGRNKILKVLGVFYRALQLAPFVMREKPDLALSHGARSQIIISNLFRIPTVLMADYEFAQYPPFMRPAWEMVPEVIPDEALYCRKDRVRKYPGLKEDVYVNRMRINPAFLNSIGVATDEMLITVRPPATEAHYHNPAGEKLFVHFMERASQLDRVRIVLLPRNTRQGESIKKSWPRWFENSRTIIPRTALDGLNLLWHSDLVVSGGGTMNREAAALGVPVFSIFRGKTGAIDLHLQRQGRLIMVETDEDVDRKIKMTRRLRNGHVNGAPSNTLSVVVNHIVEILSLES